jgi:hypothetical protein
MAISLIKAQEAVSKLKKSTGAAMFNAMSASQGYLFSKHTDKATALAAAKSDHQTKGYFKKTVTKQVDSLATYKNLSERQKKHIQGLNSASPKAKDFGRNKTVSTTVTQALQSDEFASLLYNIICAAVPIGYYCANAVADVRFLYITQIPNGYVGRSIDEQGAKSKGLNRAVVLISAPAIGNPVILNLFPADLGYVNHQAALV